MAERRRYAPRIKLCPRCRCEKPFEEFYISRATGLPSNYCKTCWRAFDRTPARRAAHNERGRREYHKNKERVLERAKRHQATQKYRDRVRRWTKTDKFKRIQKRYQAKPEVQAIKKLRARVWAAGRRARQYGATNRDFRRTSWLHLLQLFAGCCAYCGIDNQKLTIEHLTPLSRAGEHALGNIVPACMQCNYSKGPRTLEEFAAIKKLDAARIRSLAEAA